MGFKPRSQPTARAIVSLESTGEDPTLTLARDLSGNDRKLVSQVERFLENPPTSLEVIGFYGGEKADASTRVYYATISALADAGFVYQIEDKYTPEIVWRWVKEGVLVPDALPEAARTVVAALCSAGHEYLEMPPAQRSQMLRTLTTHFVQATREIEADLAARDQALLSIDVTRGDTMFFAVVDAATGAKWLNKALIERDGYRAGVRSPMWDRFWTHLCYAMLFTDLEDAPRNVREPPKGTRKRDNDIPLVARPAQTSSSASTHTTYLRFSQGKSHKFWQIVVSGRSHTVSFGRIGTVGQSKTKTFASPEAAADDAARVVRQKRGKGYR